MSLGVIGKKLGMTRIFSEESQSMIPVTVIDVQGNEIVQVKTVENDGYSAVQVGYGEKKDFRVNKAAAGHFKKHNAKPKYVVQEFRFKEGEELPAEHPGAAVFSEGQMVDVIGVTKGRGFQGAVKRHNFGGSPMTHGSMMHRRTGSVGTSATPGRVWKNKKMPGHMGVAKRTVQNLKVVGVRAEDGAILIAGAVPGHNGAYVTVRPAVKNQTA